MNTLSYEKDQIKIYKMCFKIKNEKLQKESIIMLPSALRQ
jgi:hypothetical protein